MVRIEMSDDSYESVVKAIRRILSVNRDEDKSYPQKLGICQGCAIAIDVALECAKITKEGVGVTYAKAE